MNITFEACPPENTVPSWLIANIASGRDDILVIYPNESTRSNSIQSILQKTGTVDSSRHTTLQRLTKALAIDFRLPSFGP